jgi:hypothetical protein
MDIVKTDTKQLAITLFAPSLKLNDWILESSACPEAKASSRVESGLTTLDWEDFTR